MGSVLALVHVNAFLNIAAATAIFIAYRHIRAGNREAHRRFMMIGMGASALFLVFYFYYHFEVGFQPFQGEGWVRPVYFTILATHVVLAAVILLLVPVTAWLALSERFEIHRRLAKWTFPIWLYVSVTGVTIYLMSHLIWR
ncbi:MAG: DUF420 domain-containing protein [Magnetococcales bacterium]|nr:DUF420 domain-containing protein [Magnetococcales bacterium]